MNGAAAAALAAAAMVAFGTVPRALLAAGALPDALRPLVWSDVLYIWERGLSGGRIPYRDGYFEYPPVVGYLSAALSIGSATAAIYVIAWGVVQAAVAAATAVLLARQAGADSAVRRWSLAPQLLLFGPLNFDLLAVLALVAAVHSERAGRAASGVVALAIGTAAKLFPAVAVPIVLLRGVRLDGIGGIAARALLFTAVLAAWYAPAAAAPFSSLESLRRYAAGTEANFDSFWGVLATTLARSGIDAGGAIALVTVAGLLLTYGAAVLPAALRSRGAAPPIGLAVVTLLLWSRLYSPQYSLWVLPFFALAALPRTTFIALGATDVVVFASVYPLTLVAWAPGDAWQSVLSGVLAAAVVLRHAALALTWRDLWTRCRP